MDYNQMFIEKYNYLNENANFIVKPNTIYSIELDGEMLKSIESILLSSDNLDDTYGYKYIESLKKDKKYLKKYKKSLKKRNSYDMLKSFNQSDSETFDLIYLIYRNIKDDSDEYIGKTQKLYALDLYANYDINQKNNTNTEEGITFCLADITCGIPINNKIISKLVSTITYNDYDFINYLYEKRDKVINKTKIR